MQDVTSLSTWVVPVLTALLGGGIVKLYLARQTARRVPADIKFREAEARVKDAESVEIKKRSEMALSDKVGEMFFRLCDKYESLQEAHENLDKAHFELSGLYTQAQREASGLAIELEKTRDQVKILEKQLLEK